MIHALALIAFVLVIVAALRPASPAAFPSAKELIMTLQDAVAEAVAKLNAANTDHADMQGKIDALTADKADLTSQVATLTQQATEAASALDAAVNPPAQ